MPSALPHVKTSKLRLLAVSEAKRSATLPDVPTIAEAGVPGYEIESGIGVVAPAATPKAVIQKLSGEMVRTLQTPEMAGHLVPRGIHPVGSTPEQYAEKIRHETAKYAKLVKASGARVD